MRQVLLLDCGHWATTYPDSDNSWIEGHLGMWCPRGFAEPHRCEIREIIPIAVMDIVFLILDCGHWLQAVNSDPDPVGEQLVCFKGSGDDHRAIVQWVCATTPEGGVMIPVARLVAGEI